MDRAWKFSRESWGRKIISWGVMEGQIWQIGRINAMKSCRAHKFMTFWAFRAWYKFPWANNWCYWGINWYKIRPNTANRANKWNRNKHKSYRTHKLMTFLGISGWHKFPRVKIGLMLAKNIVNHPYHPCPRHAPPTTLLVYKKNT